MHFFLGVLYIFGVFDDKQEAASREVENPEERTTHHPASVDVVAFSDNF